jgi:hypothetical protein
MSVFEDPRTERFPEVSSLFWKLIFNYLSCEYHVILSIQVMYNTKIIFLVALGALAAVVLAMVELWLFTQQEASRQNIDKKISEYNDSKLKKHSVSELTPFSTVNS